MIGVRVRRTVVRLATGILLMLAAAPPASGQYFGRQKVRYRSFDFKVVKTPHFDIYLYLKDDRGIDIAARLAERWYARYSRLFEHSLSSRQPLILYNSHTDFAQTNVIGEELGEGTGGVTEPVRRRIVLPFGGPLEDTEHVIGHELVHAFQFDIAGEVDSYGNGSALGRLPLWFVEGMAEYLSLGNIDANTAMKLRDALQSGKLPEIGNLDRSQYFPYQWGHAVLAYIAGRYGDSAIPQLLRSASAARDVNFAIETVLGTSVGDLSRDWHAAIEESYKPVLNATTSPGVGNRIVIQANRFAEDLNIGPALSPDGRWLAFLSSRTIFSTDLFVADATTGRIIRKLTNTAGSQHFSSIEFIRSAGAWDPASERIAVATVVAGKPTIAIIRARTGERLRDIPINGVDEAIHPAWSNDGKKLAFTTLHEGLSDLYIYNLETSTLVRCTDDPYADLQPAWAPDNRHIAFATDRFSTDLKSLSVGPLQLALIDTESRRIDPLPTLGSQKEINPQWSPDGDALYFIGAPDGVPNVYRVTVATGDIQQVTAIATGVSGIVASSPALSVARNNGRLAFSVFENDKYNIYVREPSQRGRAVQSLATNAAALPPDSRLRPLLPATGGHDDRIEDPRYTVADYRPHLQLVGVTQTAAGIGVNQFGMGANGAAAMMFSDTLGDHVLASAFQFNSGLDGGFHVSDIALEAAYLDMTKRWSWGVLGGQTPYVIGMPGANWQVIYRQVERNIAGILAYPIDPTRRIEFRSGLTQRTYDETFAFAKTPSLNLATTAAALVMDSAHFGPTSPVQGERYRFEVSPSFGTTKFTGVLLDYRRYVMPVSFYTIAARVLHYGRYGEGSDDPRLDFLYIDNPAFVRGYDSLDFDSGCVGSLTACSTLRGSRGLTGSRMLVGNLELRFPLLRPLGVSGNMYGPIPIEAAVFSDSGVAWSRGTKPELFGGTQPRVSSAGFAVRVGLGMIVTEFDFTRAFDRNRGWVYGFNLMPGW